MPDSVSVLDSLPDIDFIDGKTLEQTRSEMIADYESYMQDIGQPVTLDRADPHRAILCAGATQFYQGLMCVDRAGKLNLLKYTYGGYLDNVAALKGVTRIASSAAMATLRFSLEAARASATGIPKGTRVSTQAQLYFATDEYAEIPAGSTYIDVPATCTALGTAGNGIAAGELNVMVDPVPYIASVSNISVTEGGAETEEDASMKERAYLAPSQYAPGTEPGYYYRAKAYSSAIGDVIITSNQKAGKVDIVFLKDDGSSPDATLISGLQAYMRENDGRILNDLITCAAPEEVEYTINFTYYIKSSDASRAVAIQTAVEEAVKQYQTEQRSIGKDVVPEDLIDLVKAAGAKRLNITDASFAPVFTVVGANKVAVLSGEATVTYGGLEDG